MIGFQIYNLDMLLLQVNPYRDHQQQELEPEAEADSGVEPTLAMVPAEQVLLGGPLEAGAVYGSQLYKI